MLDSAGCKDKVTRVSETKKVFKEAMQTCELLCLVIAISVDLIKFDIDKSLMAIGVLHFPQDEGTVEEGSGNDVCPFWMHFDVFYVVHVIGVALEVQLPQLLVGAGVLKDPDGAHLVSNDDMIFGQSHDGCDFIFAAVAIVYFLSLGTDAEPFLLPF